MRELPSYQLDPRIKNVWRISDAIWTSIICIPLLIIEFAWMVNASSAGSHGAALIALAITAILYIGGLILLLGVLPPIRYARWRYELSNDYLDISHGIFWRKRIIVPFIRVQNTDTEQGPILRAFNLSSVTVSTAGGSLSIPGLPDEEAEVLRDKAAELARLAREDV